MKRIEMQLQGKVCKLLYIAGPPGSGKTLLTQILVLFAISKGCNVTITSLQEEQVMLSGGQHLYLLFNIFSKSSNYSHLLLDTNNCIRNLWKNEISCIVLSQLNIIVFEELSLISLQLYSIPDITMRYLMINDLKMGGKLVIGNKDPFQL